MPQPAVHAILALATRKTFSIKRWFAFGLIFGSLIPDADGYPQAFAILVQGMDAAKAETIYHRTLTHSLYFALGALALFYLISLVKGGRELRIFGLGLATGMALLHSVVDVFAWFDGVGLLWPTWSINLWGGFTMPELLGKLLRAANFWAFAAYLAYLASLARKASTNADYLPRVRRYMYGQVALGVVFTILAFVLPASSYNIPDGAVFLFWAYPNALWVTWRMRDTIEA